ncbi:hypothetical protein Peur_014199 [Populus x canadensis]
MLSYWREWLPPHLPPHKMFEEVTRPKFYFTCQCQRRLNRFIRLLSPHNNSPAAVHGGTQGCNPIVSSLTLFWCIRVKNKTKAGSSKKASNFSGITSKDRGYSRRSNVPQLRSLRV